MNRRERLIAEARKMKRLAMELRRKELLLTEAGYFINGERRTDGEGERILHRVEADIRELPQFTDSEVDAELGIATSLEE
jgi:hypothetical protein